MLQGDRLPSARGRLCRRICYVRVVECMVAVSWLPKLRAWWFSDWPAQNLTRSQTRSLSGPVQLSRPHSRSLVPMHTHNRGAGA
eukprot:4910253-Pyramimonas_sp.AAC.1